MGEVPRVLARAEIRPLPSCPLSLLPQAQSVPSERMAAVWLEPVDTLDQVKPGPT